MVPSCATLWFSCRQAITSCLCLGLLSLLWISPYEFVAILRLSCAQGAARSNSAGCTPRADHSPRCGGLPITSGSLVVLLCPSVSTDRPSHHAPLGGALAHCCLSSRQPACQGLLPALDCLSHLPQRLGLSLISSVSCNCPTPGTSRTCTSPMLSSSRPTPGLAFGLHPLPLTPGTRGRPRPRPVRGPTPLLFPGSKRWAPCCALPGGGRLRMGVLQGRGLGTQVRHYSETACQVRCI